jgi:hypothetical protein
MHVKRLTLSGNIQNILFELTERRKKLYNKEKKTPPDFRPAQKA